jgi:hypothetical protein
MVRLGRQGERGAHVDQARYVVEPVLDPVEAEYAVDRRDIERAVAERHAVRLGDALQDDLAFALSALVGDRVDAADDPGADEDRALVAARHHAGTGDAVRPELDLEALRYAKAAQRHLAGWIHLHRCRVGRQRRAFVARRPYGR